MYVDLREMTCKPKILGFLVCVLANALAYAAPVQVDGLWYELNTTDHLAKVESGDYSSLTALNIPDAITYDNVSYTVVGVNYFAFTTGTNITSVTIGKNVTFIDMLAFSGCTKLTSFTCNAITPPELGLSVFDIATISKIPLTVPTQSIAAYKTADQWKDFKWPEYCTISVISADETKGKVSGGGLIEKDKSVTLTATAEDCFAFDQWNDGNTENPRTVTVTGDAKYTAYFTNAQYKIKVETDNAAQGSVSAKRN